MNIYFEIFSQRNFAWVGKQKYGELRWDLMLLKWSYKTYIWGFVDRHSSKARDRVSRDGVLVTWSLRIGHRRSRGHRRVGHVMIKTRLVNKHKKGELDKKIRVWKAK